MSDFMTRLREKNERLQQAQVQENRGSDAFEDGNYVVAIEKAMLTAVKSGDNQGEAQVAWWLRVNDGPAGLNRIIFHYHGLFGRDDEMLDKRISRLKTDLHRLEQDFDDFEQLPIILQIFEDSQTQIKITLKTGTTGIQNCYFNGLAE